MKENKKCVLINVITRELKYFKKLGFDSLAIAYTQKKKLNLFTFSS